MDEASISKKEFSSNVIDLRDNSKLQWIKALDNKSLGMIMRHFIKKRWFFVYKSRYQQDYLIFSSGVDLEKDLPAKANWVEEK